jgi:uncharacterized protein YjbJ (UPF0337 family)
VNRDILSGKWKQLKGEVKRQWGQLTDDELDIIDGQREKLAGKLQEKYGWSRERSEREIDTFLDETGNRY